LEQRLEVGEIVLRLRQSMTKDPAVLLLRRYAVFHGPFFQASDEFGFKFADNKLGHAIIDSICIFDEQGALSVFELPISTAAVVDR